MGRAAQHLPLEVAGHGMLGARDGEQVQAEGKMRLESRVIQAEPLTRPSMIFESMAKTNLARSIVRRVMVAP